MINNRDFWHDHRDIALLLRAMVDAGFNAEQLVEVVEKPWKWRDEYKRIVNGETPSEVLNCDW